MITVSDLRKWNKSNIFSIAKGSNNVSELVKLKSKITGLEKLIEKKGRRLQKLKEQEAHYGVSVEPSVSMEIENIEEELEQLKASHQECRWELEEAEIPPQAREEIVRVYLREYPVLDLTGRRLKKIPDRIFKMEHRLKKLKLGKNKISEISGAITNLRYLEYLDMSENQLVELPSQICLLRKLERLSFKNNQLQTLPEDIGNLANLSTLDISDNQLKELPLSFRNLRNLKRTPQNPEPFRCDEDKMKFPPSDIIKQGIDAILDFLHKESEKKQKYQIYLVEPKTNLSPNNKMSICRNAAEGQKRVWSMQEAPNSPKTDKVGEIRQFTAVAFGETKDGQFQNELNKPRNKILIVEPK
jgi:hypothetical protein